MTDRITGELPEVEEPVLIYEAAISASSRLARMAEHCENFYVAISVLGYIGAAVLIYLGVVNDFGVWAGAGLAVGITVSLLPVLLFCRWAHAYAADLEMRASL